MFTFLRVRYLRVLDVLDLLSNRIRTRTYNFPNLIPAQYSGVGDSNRSDGWNRRLILEVMLVLVFITLLAVVSRNAQYAMMANLPASYFLSELRNVSTTHDAGFYMQLAKEWLLFLDAGRGFWQVQDGDLLGYLLAVSSLSFDISLEQTARIFLYAAVTATAFSAYLLLLTLGQSLLGILVAGGLVFFFPAYGRTSLGMVDTDQLNVFFVLFIVAALTASARAKSREAGLIFMTISALACQAFWLWYGRSGFLMLFIGTYLAVLASFRVNNWRALLLFVVFTLAAGAGQFGSVLSSLSGFLNRYVLRSGGGEDLGNPAVSAASSLETTVFATISEITRISNTTVINDFGSEIAFGLAITGFFFWLLQDWRRFSVALPFLAFFALYLTAGQRFSLFSAPAALIGIFVSLSNILWVLWSLLKTLVSAEGFADRNAPEKRHISNNVAGASAHPSFVIGRRLSCLVILLVSCWIGGVFPPLGVTPPPVIRAEELNMINKSLKDVSRNEIIMASWWDYGYELRYQTGIQVISDGSNPANIKNVYIARALISTEPGFAADELRFAAYFDLGTLRNSYPRRPDTELSTNTNKDIYLFLPSDLQDKMINVFNIAAATVSKDALQGYNSDESAFVILYHQQPQNWGPFQLVQGQKEGGVLYRLPAPPAPKN